MKSLKLSHKFHPPQRPNAPGSHRLDMIIREPSIGESADLHELEQISLRIAAFEDLPEMATFSHPWPYTDQQRVCAGRIALKTKKGDSIAAFTFGGDLQIQLENNKTVFTFTSSAPILRLEEFNRIPTILANEVAILFAERRAKELPDLDAYNKSLVCTFPLLLYCACLKALKWKFKDFSYSYYESPSIFAFSSFLTTEIESLHAANLWPNRVPDLVDLL